MHCVEYRDLVAAHADEQLTAEEAPLAEAHVAGCAGCARLLRTQRAVAHVVRGRNLICATPDAVRRAIIARIEVDEQASATGWWQTWWSRPALAGVLGLLVVAVVLPLLRSGQRTPALLDTVVADYRAAESDRVELRVRTEDPIELRAYYLKAGTFSFGNTVVDLEPLGFVLVGGTIGNLAGRPSTLSVYRGTRGMILCHRIDATGVELPPGGEVIGGDRFYSVDGITICLHREGDLLCFMASAIPRADFIRMLAGHV